jgi:hypothetical protein
MTRHGLVRRFLPPAVLAVLAAWLTTASGQQGQQFIQYGFEARDPVWVRGSADARFNETAHKLSDDLTAHTGKRSEYFELDAEPGTYIHYTYDVGRAPVCEELAASFWVKGNRPGAQLLCRVVLPHERDPNDVGQPLTVLTKGDKYMLTGRWQQLALRQPDKRLREQQQILQAEMKRAVDVSDAYVDRLVFNVYSGPGLTRLWVDDLEIGPVLDAKPVAPQQPRGITGRPVINRRTAVVSLEGSKLLVSGKPFFPRIIRHTGTPLKALREAGFNTVLLDETTPPGLIDDAVAKGFWLAASVTPPASGGSGTTQLTSSNETFARAVARFLDQDAVLWWDLGTNLEYEKYQDINQAARAFRAADPMRPVSGDVWDGFLRYSRGIDQMLIGVHRWPLMTGLELIDYRNWLMARRQLAQPGTFYWTWIQTHLPDWFLQTAYGKAGPAGGSNPEPLGPQAEQVRLLAYTAIGCGYRGLGFWSDRFLSDVYTGRDRLLGLALLNQELELLEPLLVSGKDACWIDTSNPDVKAAVIRSDDAVLVLPVWMGAGSQFVPGQSALTEVNFVVPQVPGGSWAYEVSPGQIRSLSWQRVVGGTKVSLHEFSLTSAVVFTADLSPTGLVVKFQERQRSMVKMAAQYAHDQAMEELAKVERVNTELEQAGHRQEDAAALLAKAKAYLDSCDVHRRDGRYNEAYAEAQRALRPLRILMRAQWDAAVRPLSLPVSSPYAVSFYSLPQHWRFVNEVTQLRADANVLPGGDFEQTDQPAAKIPPQWRLDEIPSLDPVAVTVTRTREEPKEGRQCLVLEIKPKTPGVCPIELERTFLALQSPAVKLPPGTKVRISAWVRIPFEIKASQDGALFFDSAGGEPLAFRSTHCSGWKRYILYREVPATGTINVTLALTGIGKVYFDDVRIEPLVATGAPPTAAPAPVAAAPVSPPR